jgi:hypothetical protein
MTCWPRELWYAMKFASGTYTDLAEFGSRSPVRFQRKNGEGWFRVDLRKS